MTTEPHRLLRGSWGALALAAAVVALGGLASGATAAGSGPYAMEAEALFSPSRTDLALQVGGPDLPTHLGKVRVKAWRPGDDEPTTRNFFGVPLVDGVARVPLSGLARGDRLEVQAHVKDGPQFNLDADTIVLRRPDLTVEAIDVPDDIVRTRAFDVSVTIAEDGGDVGAKGRLLLFDGASTTPLMSSPVHVAAGGSSVVTLRVALARPREHMLRVVVAESSPAEWDVAPNDREQELYVNHYAQNGVVATDHPEATRVGVEVLETGGNAFDAAVAVQFALNVVQPHFGGIGGGSNIVLRDGKTGELFAIDAREIAPAATTPTTYKGVPVNDVRKSGFAVGVPGTLKAAEYVLDRWGTTTLPESLDWAIQLAEEGFPIGQSLATQIGVQSGAGILHPETKAIFLNPNGTVPQRGTRLMQLDLAKTFRLLARDGADAFYRGEIAQAIVAAQQRATTPGREGKMTLADLDAYTIDVERPLSVGYKGYDVYAPAAGGTSGGVVMLESLGLMREFLADPRNSGYAWGFGTPNSLHVFIESMRLAFADRDFWLGDDRYTDVPAAGLLDSAYLRGRSALINQNTAICGPGGALPPGQPPLPASALDARVIEGEEPGPGHTTHFSIIDRWGNAVVWTTTLRNAFGSGITVPGYGFLLNDSMGLFNPDPHQNASDPGANDAAGGKRAMGNMTPTLILKNGEPFAGTGSLGSGFIQSVVLNVVLNLIEYNLPLQQAIDAPRAWTQFSTGATQLNLGWIGLIDPVRAMGHVLPCAGNLNRMALVPPGTPGSTGSFAVELDDFSLVGGADATRFVDATAAVVERS